jgi:hypothetical protein
MKLKKIRMDFLRLDSLNIKNKSITVQKYISACTTLQSTSHNSNYRPMAKTNWMLLLLHTGNKLEVR